MKIAIVRQRYNPFGGAERFVEAALSALGSQNLDLTLITREWQGDIENGGRRVLVCNPKHFGRLQRDRSFSGAVQQAIDQEHFDIVQSHERIPGCTVFRAGDGVHAAWLEQRARIQTSLGRLGSRLSPWHRYTLAAERAMFADPRLKAVICISELVRRDVQRFYHVPDEKLHVIYNGIDLERFHPQNATIHRQRVRQEYGIPADAPVFLYVGSGFERKGVAPLLKAFARANLADARLLVVGSDKHLSRYRQMAGRLGIGEHVRFAGGVHDPVPYYGAADIFVLPTLYEPLSNAVLEALACGLPAIVSNTCGAAELISPGLNGDICDALDDAMLARLLRSHAQCVGNSQTRDSARNAVLHLSLKAMSERLCALYRGLLADSTHGYNSALPR